MDQLTFVEDGHAYYLGERRLPSVTQALAVIENFDHVSPAILEAARKFGAHVHKACHLLNIGQLDEPALDAALVPYVAGYKKFLYQSRFEVQASEERVYNKLLLYAGTRDLRGMLAGRKAIVDLKSGAVPRSVGPQTAAYLNADPDGPLRAFARRFALQLKPNDYRLIECKEVSDFAVFQSCLNIFNFLNRGRFA